MQESSPRLHLQAVLGIKWNFLGQFLVFLFTLVGTVILSRLISPSEYGLFGMITVITNLANMVVGLGVAMAIVQQDGLSRKDKSSVFWLNIIIGGVMCLFFYISAPLIANFYGQPQLIFISRLYSFGFLLHAAKSVPIGLLTRESNFKHLTYSQVIANIFSFSIAIILALNDFGVVSLVVQVLVANFIVAVLTHYYAKWLPLFVLQKESLVKIKFFIIHYLPSQIIDFFATNLDIVLVGKFFGTRTVGLYGKAIALVMIPVSLISHVFNKSFYPIFAKVKSGGDEIKMIYLKSFRTMVVVIVPIFILITILPEELLLILFGHQWVEAAGLVQVLGIYAIFFSLNSFNDTFLLSQGKADWLLKINVLDKIVLVVLFISAIKFGVMYFALAKLIFTVLTFGIKYYIASTLHRVTFYLGLKSTYKVLIALSALVVISILSKLFFIDANIVVRVMSVSTLSLLSFILLLYLLKDDSLKDITNSVRTYLDQ